MRLARLSLTAYGHFSDTVIELPQSKPDLHLIIGPNEAGKSTIRQAIGDFLFGIPAQSHFNFVHDYPDMRIGMCIQHGGASLELARKKGRVNTLLDPAGNAVADAQLEGLLVRADRALFEQMFGLSWQSLGQGAEDMLQAKGDIGAMLFEASSGIAHLADLHGALRNEADSAYGHRKNQTKAFYIARAHLEDATRRLKDAAINPDTYKKDLLELRAARRSAGNARRHFEQLRERLQRLRRIRSLAPKLTIRDQNLAGLAELDGASALPETAREDFDACRAAISRIESQLVLRRDDLARGQAQLSALAARHGILDRAVDVEDLRQRASQYRAYPGDIDKREQEVESSQLLACAKAREVGWGDLDFNALQPRQATRIQIVRLRELAGRHGALLATVKETSGWHEAMQQDISEHRAALDASEVNAIPAGLPQATKAAGVAMGRAGDRVPLLMRIEAQSRELTTLLETLSPWTGTVGALRALPEIDLAVATDLRQEAERHQRDQRQAEHQVRAEQREQEGCETRISALTQGFTAIAEPQITDARAARDQIWFSIRSDGEVQSRAAGFESRLHAADALADRRYAHAEEAHRLETEIAVRARLVDQVKQTLADGQTAQRRAAECTMRWEQTLANAGLPRLDWATYHSWCARRADALRRAAVAEELKQQLAALDSAVASARSALIEQLEGTAIFVPDDGRDLPALVAEVTVHIERADTQRAEYDSASKQMQRLHKQEPLLAQKLGAAQMALDSWRNEWCTALAALGLPADLAPASADTVIESLGAMNTAMDRATEIRRTRIDTMRGDLERLAFEARSVATALGIQAEGHTARVLVDELERQLAAARALEDQRLDLERTIAAAAVQIEELEQQRLEAQSGLASLIEQAGVESADFAGLGAAISRSDEIRGLRHAVDALEREILENGDGLDLAALREEARAEDLTTIAAEIESLEDADRSAVNEMTRCTEHETALRLRLEGLNLEGAAAAAEFDRQSALAEMADAAGRYVRAHIQERLLSSGIEHFRSHHQTPILEQASVLFNELTCASFEGLEVDWDADPPVLVGVRNGKRLRVDAMSSGTRDQLYLALRLAALHLHLKGNVGLPFVADDLFVNGDDGRCGAAFKALAKLATQTQVLYFTHHAHLEGVIRDALNDAINVVHLDGRGGSREG